MPRRVGHHAGLETPWPFLFAARFPLALTVSHC